MCSRSCEDCGRKAIDSPEGIIVKLYACWAKFLCLQCAKVREGVSDDVDSR